MSPLLSSSLAFFLGNICLALAIDHEHSGQCKSVGNFCETNNDCCSSLICYAIEGRASVSLWNVHSVAILGLNLCLPSTIDPQYKRQTEELIIPPYYNPSQQLYPYGISQPGLPFHKGHESKASLEGKKLGNEHQERERRNLIIIFCVEWDHCQFHEDCGEGNCCYVHFRFRSLPKWFCRPNRSDASDLCEPLAKYRSLKDVPGWKEQTPVENPSEQR